MSASPPHPVPHHASTPKPPDEADENALRLRAEFAAVSRRADRRRWWKRLPERALVFAWVFAIGAWLLLALVIVTPWPLETSLRHFAAAWNCDTARAVGLAPARKGEPGYWPWLDRDKDGIACEPWR